LIGHRKSRKKWGKEIVVAAIICGRPKESLQKKHTNATIIFSKENTPLGTAVHKKAESILKGEEPFFVINVTYFRT